MQNIKIAIIQSDLVWENREKNLERFEGKISEVKENIDLIALPEMFSTGFVVNPTRIAEGMEGPSKKAGSKKLCMEITSGSKGDREYGLCYWGEQGWHRY